MTSYIQSRDNPAEIEVTEAMVEAGLLVFLAYDSRFDHPQTVIADLYAAMVKVGRSR